VKTYSIVRIGSDYVVQADEKSVLKIASRRRAARLVSDAAELLDAHAVTKLRTPARTGPSSAHDPKGIIPDPGITLDPGITPDHTEVP
jgi:hypothetical protein